MAGAKLRIVHCYRMHLVMAVHAPMVKCPCGFTDMLTGAAIRRDAGCCRPRDSASTHHGGSVLAGAVEVR